MHTDTPETNNNVKAGRDRVSIFLPTLNEIEALRVILPRLKREWFDEILVVDGGSTDGTVQFLEENGIRVMQQEKKGAGRLWNQAFNNTTGEIFIVFAPDGNCIPELIPDLIEEMRQGRDLVCVSRYLPPAVSYDDTLITGFGNRMFRHIINILFRCNFTDPLGSFRGYRRSAVHRMRLHMQQEENALRRKERFDLINTWEVAGVIRAAKLKLNTKEIPGDEPARIGGESQIRIIWNGLMIVGQIILELFSGKRNLR